MPPRRTRRSRSEAAAGGISAPDTLNSGQVFCWERAGGAWYAVDGQRVVRLPGGGRRAGASDGGAGGFLREGDDLGAILGGICRDGRVAAAVRAYPGLRLLRQDPFQCCVSFIASANSNIGRIRGTLRALCGRFGGRARLDGREFAVFPTPRRLARASVAELRACGLGYRAPYVRGAAAAAAGGGIDLPSLRGRGYAEARDALLGLPGVGPKVADCAMLFSLDRLDAFPMDRWVLRVLRRRYPGAFTLGAGAPTPKRYEALHGEAVARFGPHAGYAQQFLFKAEREAEGRAWG